LITGGTHSRELLSTQVPLYQCLKLIHQGFINRNDKYANMLKNTKFHFVPILNVDGSALVEQGWAEDHKILNKRKNMNPSNSGTCGEENSGVDLNRNWGRDWAPANVKNKTELCGDFLTLAGAQSRPQFLLRSTPEFSSPQVPELLGFMFFLLLRIL
jgi:murein tripeptide amidase MpaA